MLKKNHGIVACACALWFLGGLSLDARPVAGEQDLTPSEQAAIDRSLEELRNLRVQDKAAMHRCTAKYVLALERIYPELAKQDDSQGSLWVQKELKACNTGKATPSFSPGDEKVPEALRTARASFDHERKKLREQAGAAEQREGQRAIQRLKKLQVQWTEKTRVGAARAAKDTVDALGRGEDPGVLVIAAASPGKPDDANKAGIPFLWCPSGSFMMGSPEEELGRSHEQELQHEVTLSGFWLGATEVTQAQFKAVMGSNPSGFKSPQLPVESVDWDTAMAFCKKLTALARKSGRLPVGWEFTLPTEAQWEYACRAGTTSALNNGGELTAANGSCLNLKATAWYKRNSGKSTHVVMQMAPNSWGFHDMHGNVQEWCLGWFAGKPSDGRHPGDPASGSMRACRGGGWITEPSMCRSAARHGRAPDFKRAYLGFRAALVPAK